MREVRRELERDGSGTIALIAEEAEDLWHVFNLLATGDRLQATAVRRVQSESATGSVDSARVVTTLTIVVARCDYDPSAAVVRVSGRTCAENPYVRLGAHHTLDIELNRRFAIAKRCWDSVALARLADACAPSRRADLAAVLIQEGLAHICLLTPALTLMRQKVDMAVPRKRRGSSEQHDRALDRFYDAVLEAVLRHVDFALVKCIIVAGPGFAKDEFLAHMDRVAAARELRPIFENRAKFVAAHASSAFLSGLREVLADPSLAPRLADTKAAAEIRALDQFHQMLGANPDRAFYGFRHVQRAAELGAVDTLLLSDNLFR
jgi:protein pelota